MYGEWHCLFSTAYTRGSLPSYENQSKIAVDDQSYHDLMDLSRAIHGSNYQSVKTKAVTLQLRLNALTDCKTSSTYIQVSLAATQDRVQSPSSFFFVEAPTKTNDVHSTRIFLPCRRHGSTLNSIRDRTPTFICCTQLWWRPGGLLHRKLQPRRTDHIKLYNLYVSSKAHVICSWY